MNIAIMGTRGVPASYSGFETCAEQLGSRLAARGHRVTVYCRSHHIDYALPTYLGMHLVKLPAIRNKYLDTLCHTFVSVLHGWFCSYDLVLFFIAGNSPVAFLPRLRGQKTVLNVDGLDWKREKWPAAAKLYIKIAERLAPLTANRVVTDSQSVYDYYRQVYGADTTYIAYGSDIEPLPPGKTLNKYGLEPRGYILYVGRLVPENGAHHLVEAFNRLERRRGLKLVIVGDAPYADDYISSLRNQKDPDIIFTGYVFGEGYRELGSNAYTFAVTSGVGGTHPVLLEALAMGNCVLVNDTPSSIEVVGDAAVLYRGADSSGDLHAHLQYLVDHPDVVQEYRIRGKDHVDKHYRWDHIADQYEALFMSLTRQGAAQLGANMQTEVARHSLPNPRVSTSSEN